jgi:hypothetical protein
MVSPLQHRPTETTLNQLKAIYPLWTNGLDRYYLQCPWSLRHEFTW